MNHQADGGQFLVSQRGPFRMSLDNVDGRRPAAAAGALCLLRSARPPRLLPSRETS